MEQYIYICESPVLNAYKIGYHTGTPYALHMRYQTSYGSSVSFSLFKTDMTRIHETIIHQILGPYKITNEIFHKNDQLYLFYCYIIKNVTNCETMTLYSQLPSNIVRGQMRSLKQLEEVLNQKISTLNPCEYIVPPDFIIDDLLLEDMSKLNIEQPSPFGQTNLPALGSPFGQTNLPQFGQSNWPSLGSPFGQATIPQFGQTNQLPTIPQFGQSNQLPMSSPLGQTNLSQFGQSNQLPMSSPFGQTNWPSLGSPFGQSNLPALGSPFGQSSQPALDSPFGQSNQSLMNLQMNSTLPEPDLKDLFNSIVNKKSDHIKRGEYVDLRSSYENNSFGKYAYRGPKTFEYKF